MTVTSARHQLAQDIQLALGDAWTVYASPPASQLLAPAVILAPRPPYRRRGTVCDEQVNLRGSVLVQVARGADALDYMDDACTQVRDAVHSSSIMAVVEEISEAGPVTTEGDVEYLSATLNITMEVDKT